MTMNNSGNFEAFLVEDMILTLANLRASLSWLSGTSGDGGRHRAGWDRFDRQLEMLEARARDLLEGVKDRGRAPAPTPVRRTPEPAVDEDDIGNLFLFGAEDEPVRAVFQSRRHAG